MRWSLVFVGLAVLLVVLPLIGLVFFTGLIRTAAQIILSLVLIVLMVLTGVFGFICVKAQARAWGAALLIVALLCLLAIFWMWTGKILLVA